MGTDGNAGQQRWRTDQPPRGFTWCSFGQLLLHVLPGVAGNDGRDFNADPFLAWPDGAGPAVLHIEPMLAGIGLIGQDAVDAGDHERLAAKALTGGIQLRDD
ncbi:MAG: hypothetical protein KGQ79_00705 [Proteobacteria bacterium]|nr:hypothetical protein [Pseudomonadota bacterium]MBU6424900.1 hypothetical protein [Rhodospirillales bacterium]